MGLNKKVKEITKLVEVLSYYNKELRAMIESRDIKIKRLEKALDTIAHSSELRKQIQMIQIARQAREG